MIQYLTSINCYSSAGSNYFTSSSYSANSELYESILCFHQHVSSCTTTPTVDNDFYTQMIETSFKTNIHVQVMDTQVTDHHPSLVSVP